MSALWQTRWLSGTDLIAWRGLRSEALKLFPEAFLTTLAEFQAQSDEAVRAVLDQGKMLGVFEGRDLIGAGAFLRFGRTQTCHRAEIGAFYVSAAHHGSGVADRLMADLMAYAKALEISQLELFAWDGNPRAIGFYQRHGFVEMGRLPNAVKIDGKGRDDLFFVKVLDER